MFSHSGKSLCCSSLFLNFVVSPFWSDACLTRKSVLLGLNGSASSLFPTIYGRNGMGFSILSSLHVMAPVQINL